MGDARAPWPDDEFVEYAQARQHTLLRAAYLVCGDVRLAEDLVRASLVQLARQWERVREEQPDLFVRRVLYRDAIASWRKRAHEQVATTPKWDEPDEPWDAEDSERRREVLRALDGLTPRQRAVVVLCWFEERPQIDAAHVLGCTTAAVRAQADEALASLRTTLPTVDLGAGGAGGPGGPGGVRGAGGAR